MFNDLTYSLKYNYNILMINYSVFDINYRKVMLTINLLRICKIYI